MSEYQYVNDIRMSKCQLSHDAKMSREHPDLQEGAWAPAGPIKTTIMANWRQTSIIDTQPLSAVRADEEASALLTVCCGEIVILINQSPLPLQGYSWQSHGESQEPLSSGATNHYCILPDAPMPCYSIWPCFVTTMTGQAEHKLVRYPSQGLPAVARLLNY